MINHFITGGCSFTHWENSWVNTVENYLKSKNNNLTSLNTSFPSQGQGMIQKKVMLALVEAFNKGIPPEEILVIVMWSGTSRSVWYIDNPDTIKKMDLTDRRLLDLKNISVDSGGWYSTEHGNNKNDHILGFTQQHFLIDKFTGGVGKVHDSLENIIMLQNFCKLHNVTLIQQFYMDFVFEDIEEHKNHQIINYLYKQLDFDNIITQGMLEYLEFFLTIPKKKAEKLTSEQRIKSSRNSELFSSDGFHPGEYGTKLWCKNILFPFLKSKNI
jgi:hypothetical protein